MALDRQISNRYQINLLQIITVAIVCVTYVGLRLPDIRSNVYIPSRKIPNIRLPIFCHVSLD
jgi:hypothetical protein